MAEAVVAEIVDAEIGDQTTPAPGRSLTTNVVWTLTGNVVYAACQWLMIVSIAKIGTPEMVGELALGLAVTAPVIMLTNLQLRGVLATDARGRFEFGHYAALRLMGTATALSVIGGVAVAASSSVEAASIVFSIGIAKAIESLSDLYYGWLQQGERMSRIATSMMMKGVATVGVFCPVLYLSHSLLLSVLSMAAAWLAILIGFDRRVQSAPPSAPAHERNRMTPLWDLGKIAALARLAVPLGLVMMLLSLNANIPRYFIEHQLGEHALGIFAAVTYIAVAQGTVVNAVGQSVTPRLAKLYARRDRQQFVSMMVKLSFAGAVIGGLGILVSLVAGRQLLTIIYRPQYAEAASVLAWSMGAAAVAICASFLGNGITAAHRFDVQVPLSICSTIACAIGCALLIPSHGLVGAVWATGIGSIVQAAGSVLVIRGSIDSLESAR